MAVWQLDDELWFPNPRWGEEDGLVAIGGDLSVERLVLAYSNGFFPWYAFQMEREPHWYCPLDRYVIIPEEIHVSHSMRQLLRQQRYEVTVNPSSTAVLKPRGAMKRMGLGLDLILSRHLPVCTVLAMLQALRCGSLLILHPASDLWAVSME